MRAAAEDHEGWRITLEHVVRALRPGGFMLILMENSEQLPSRIRRWLGREVDHHDHMHFISLADLDAAFGDRFETLKAETFGYGFGLHGLTKRFRVPRQLFDWVGPIMDGIGRLIMPNAGQVLYGCYRKSPDWTAGSSENIFRHARPLDGGIYRAFQA